MAKRQVVSFREVGIGAIFFVGAFCYEKVSGRSATSDGRIWSFTADEPVEIVVFRYRL